MARVSRNASIPYRPYSRLTPEYLQARDIGLSTECRLGVSALERPSSHASDARTARLGERTNHVIADADVPDIWADCSHDTRHLVTEHRRQWDEIVGGEQ